MYLTVAILFWIVCTALCVYGAYHLYHRNNDSADPGLLLFMGPLLSASAAMMWPIMLPMAIIAGLGWYAYNGVFSWIKSHPPKGK